MDSRKAHRQVHRHPVQSRLTESCRSRAFATIARATRRVERVREFVVASHKRFAVHVAEHRTVAADRFGDEEGRCAVEVERRGVELVELKIRDFGARFERQRDAVACRYIRVGGVRKQLPRAARREDDVRALVGFVLAGAEGDALHAGGAPAFDQHPGYQSEIQDRYLRVVDGCREAVSFPRGAATPA